MKLENNLIKPLSLTSNFFQSLMIVFLIIINSNIISQHAAKIDSLKKKLEENIHDTIRVKILNNLSRETLLQGESKSSLIWANQSLMLAEKIKFKRIYAGIYINLGNAYSVLSDYTHAIFYMQKALNSRLEVNDRSGVAACYNNIGIVYYDLADYPKTLEYFQKSLKIQEELGNDHQVAATIGNIAVVYGQLHDDSLSMIYQQRSFDMHKKMGNRSDMVASLNNLSDLYLKKKNYKKAVQCLDEASAIAIKLDEKDGLKNIYGSYGSVFLAQNEYEKAREMFFKSLKLAEEKANAKDISAVLIHIATTYYKSNKIKDGIVFFEKAFKLSKKLHVIQEQFEAADGLYACYKINGDFKKALFFNEVARQLNDSIYNTSKNGSLNSLKTQFALDRQENILKLQAIEELKKQEEEKAKQRAIIYITIGILIFLLIFSYILFNRFKISRKQNKIIESQKIIVEQKNKEITDSILYAKRIQSTLLANEEFLNDNIPQNFIFFNPKDIVSGDFYWATKKEELFYLALCDSTGHGVPGAFMSLLNIGFLSEAINEKNLLAPNDVFNYVRNRLVNSVSKEGQQDGFDGVLLCINQKTKEITYAAAHNTPLLISNSEAKQLKGDKMPVGKGINHASFNLFNIDAKPGDILYLYTDGYADQFGGDKGKKFMYKQLNKVFSSICSEPLIVQKERLSKIFQDWRGNLEQVDDVLIIGIKI